MGKQTKKSKKPAKAKSTKKPFTVEIHGEDLDISLESRSTGDDDEDLSMFDKIFERLAAYANATRGHDHAELITDIEIAEKMAERGPDEDDTQYATNIVGIAMAFGRKLDANMLRVVIHTLQTELNERPAEPSETTESEPV